MYKNELNLGSVFAKGSYKIIIKYGYKHDFIKRSSIWGAEAQEILKILLEIIGNLMNKFKI